MPPIPIKPIMFTVKHTSLLTLVLFTLITAITNVAAAADAPAAKPADWPRFLGPTRDGVVPQPLAWPAGGPKALWSVAVGNGWSGPVVVDGKAIIHHRQDRRSVLDCLDLATGKTIWSSGHDTDYVDGFGFDDGPRATPAVAGDRIYTFGAEGLASCFELATGKLVWLVDVVKTFRGGKGFFGFACSPLVEGNAVLLNVGGKGSGVVALDTATGKTLWTATDDEAGYSSPTAATIDGKRYAFVLTRSSLIALTPADGKVLWRYPFRARMEASVNAATPLVVGDEIFISSSYGVGGAVLKFGADKPTVVWANDESMSNHFSTCVVKDGYLYGLHGRQEQNVELRCVDWKTGKVVWSQDDFGTGAISLAGQTLLILGEKGELIAVEASPKAFKEIGRKQVTGFETRAYPAIAGGRLVARGKQKLVCVDLASP
ncbi:PQQ-binding-like beta-propeller repeat protein [Humisphaera borealis]|uniref:PQQ-binding-like beta-propeller repeat protein n=1 Tax=Humisphaera borealis TaxID=2807512 RepID=A0A7M2WUX1_9BACT|nr:PQQ-binding-like beta-propeller repeat protein [Humisphaera borealis]QOV89347.1 PQQ-binding-like beta-propeller repeat protein [Humisphaera borealis]